MAGRQKNPDPKVLVSIRIRQGVLDAFAARGISWRKVVDDALENYLDRDDDEPAAKPAPAPKPRPAPAAAAQSFSHGRAKTEVVERRRVAKVTTVRTPAIREHKVEVEVIRTPADAARAVASVGAIDQPVRTLSRGVANPKASAKSAAAGGKPYEFEFGPVAAAPGSRLRGAKK